MNRKLSAIILVTVLLGSLLVGCGTKKDPNDNTGNNVTPTTEANQGEKPSTKEVTLKVWESTGGPDKFIVQAGEAFTKQNPNIKIEYVNVELGSTATQIALDGPAGVGPDLFVAPHDKLGELVSGGHILPTVNQEDVTNKVLGTTSTALTYDGKMYGYPVSAETYALFYNKDLIKEEEVPKTWDEVVAFSEKFNKDNSGKYGFMMNVGDGYYTIIFTTSGDNRLFGPIVMIQLQQILIQKHLLKVWNFSKI